MDEEKTDGRPQQTAPDLDSIARKCMDSAGYLVFAAVLTPNRDKDGRLMIEFQYRRYHFALEDARQSVMTLQGFVAKEIDDLVKKYQDEGGEAVAPAEGGI